MQQLSHIFKRNVLESRFAPFIAIVIALFMRFVMFSFYPIEVKEYPTSFVWQYIHSLFTNKWISFTASTLCFLIVAVLLSNLNNQFSLIRLRSSLPFSLSLVVFSTHPRLLLMSPNYLSIIFILLALFPLLNSYQHRTPRNYAFKSGILLAFAALFQVYSLVLLPLWWYGEFTMHGFKIRSFFALLLGAILLFWNVAVLFFIFNSIDLFLLPFSYLARARLTLPELNYMEWILVGTLAVINIVVVILDKRVFNRERVIIQKALSFFILIGAVATVFHILYSLQTDFFLLLFAAMASFITAHYFSYIIKKWQVYFFSFLISILFIVYLYYFINA